MEERRWCIVGCHLAPDDNSKIESVVADIKVWPHGTKLLVAVDFNANLLEPEGDQRRENISAVLATEGLEDMLSHFLPRRRSWCRDGRMWSMIREEREVRS